MIEGWTPTVELRWSKDGKLQQRWTCRAIEYRKYGGTDRRCESFKDEWRDVPTEKSK